VFRVTECLWVNAYLIYSFAKHLTLQQGYADSANKVIISLRKEIVSYCLALVLQLCLQEPVHLVEPVILLFLGSAQQRLPFVLCTIPAILRIVSNV
jgi:hypothetical protein